MFKKCVLRCGSGKKDGFLDPERVWGGCEGAGRAPGPLLGKLRALSHADCGSVSSAAGRGLGPLLSIPRQRRRVGHFPGGGEAGLEFLHICILRRRPLEPR